MDFKSHGTRTNRIEGRLFISDWVGPFNIEMRQRSHSPALQERQALIDSGPWAYVEIFHKSALAGPDYLAHEKQSNEDPQRGRNRVAAAIVIRPGVEGYGFVEDLYRDMWAGVPHPVEVFDNIDAAMAWAQAHVDAAGG